MYAAILHASTFVGLNFAAAFCLNAILIVNKTNSVIEHGPHFSSTHRWDPLGITTMTMTMKVVKMTTTTTVTVVEASAAE